MNSLLFDSVNANGKLLCTLWTGILWQRRKYAVNVGVEHDTSCARVKVRGVVSAS